MSILVKICDEPFFYAKINELLPVSLSLGEIKDGSVFQVINCSVLPVLPLVPSICCDITEASFLTLVGQS